jgi:CheY-like chemotaxis protein
LDLPLSEGPVERHQRLDGNAGVAPQVAGGDRPWTVLYIENNLSNYRLIERLLARRPGIRLLAAMQGRMGLDLARQHRPHLVLLDLHLPDLAGEEVLHRLQASPETRGIPVLVLSADATPGRIQRLLAGGARGYLTKPLEVQGFLALVDEILREGDR